MTTKSPRVLWLTPSKPENISVGRSRIAEHLRTTSYVVTVSGTTPRTILSHLREWDQYDVIVGTTRAGALVGMVLSRIYGIPLLVDHVDPINQFWKTSSMPVAAIIDLLERLAFRLAHRVLYVYPEERERVETHARATTETDLGVDFQRFSSPDTEQIETAWDQIDVESNRIVVYVGGLEPIYNINTMLDAVNHLGEEWTLIVAGDGTLRETVEQAASATDQVVYLGTVPHKTVPGILKISDVGVSLVDDPNTLKVLEYGAAGLPTVQLAGRAEAALGGAVTYCDVNPEDVAAAIETAVDTDPSALQCIAELHNWNRIAEQYAEAIDEAIAR